MGTSTLFSIPELISNKNREDQLILPDIKRISNIREYMADPDNFDGNIKTLIDRLDAESKQCECILTLLKQEVRQKKTLLDQVKMNMLDLESQLKSPEAGERFLMNRERIRVEFSDEAEVSECDVPTALDRYDVKMTTLYGKILALDTDIDFVEYLHGISLINKDYVNIWYTKTENGKFESEIKYVNIENDT